MMTPRCSRCGRPLRDPVSIALGMGSECRGSKSPSRRQIAYSHRVARGQAYTEKAPLIFHNRILSFVDGFWVSNKSGQRSTDESIRAWLKTNTLAIFPDQYADSLIIRKNAIEAALLSPLYLQGVCEREIEELKQELYRFQDVIDSLEIEEAVNE